MAFIGPVSGNMSGSLTQLGDGSSFLIAGSNVTITSASNGAVTITAAGGSGSPGGSNTQIQYNDGGSFGGDAGLMFIEASNCVFATNIHATNALSASYVVPAGGNNSIQLTSGSGADGPTGDDIFFSISGTIGGKGSEGTTAFGGDVVVSGSLSVGEDVADKPTATALNIYANVSSDYVAKIDNDQASAGHVLKLSTDGNGSGSRILEMEDGDGDVVFRARADGRFGFGPTGVSSMGAGTFVVGIDGSHSADIAISKRLQHLGDSDTYMDFPAVDEIKFVAGGVTIMEMIEHSSLGQVLILSGGAAGDADPAEYPDTNFFVSGTIGSKGTSVKGTSVFGGDLVVSGGMVIGNAPTATADGLDQDFIVNAKDQSGLITVHGDDGKIQFATSDSAGNIPIGNDTFFKVSGTIGGIDSSTGVSVFGGDMLVSGGMVVGYPPTEAADGSSQDFIVNAKDFQNLFVVDGNNATIKIGAYGDDGQEEFVGSDCKFHISGTINPLAGGGIDNRYTCLGGDTTISGSLIGVGGWGGSSSANTLNLFAGADGDGTANIYTNHINILNFGQFPGPVGNDIYLSVSGAIGSKNSSTEGTAVFGGDVNVSGSLYNTGMGGSGSGSAIKITADGKLFYDSSDWNLKKNIEPLENSLEKITQCQGVSFEYRETYGGPRHIGVIAQDIQPIIPEVVEGNIAGMLSVDYSKLTAVLIEAVKELNLEVQQLKQKISDLES